MKLWMTVKDLSYYLQISENKIRYFVKHQQIPFHNNHGFLRFSKEEIDMWMKEPQKKRVSEPEAGKNCKYHSKPIKSYQLAASKILTALRPWYRIIEFVKNCVERTKEIELHDNGRSYLFRKEFSLFSNNFNDYLNVCCHLGLIEKVKAGSKQKEYYPTIYAERIALEDDIDILKDIIRDSILDIVKKKIEAVPNERHSIFLLWYFLCMKQKGITPRAGHFKREPKEMSFYPMIRFNFSKSLCEFLFDNDRKKEQQFFKEWKKLVT